MWIDSMAVMRGVDAFPVLWARRTTAALPQGLSVDLLSLPDLVRAKKTQRDKDWPMIRRLVEADYAQQASDATPERVRFWLTEARGAKQLVELAARFPEDAAHLSSDRPLLRLAVAGDLDAIEAAVDAEASQERARDRAHWRPLIQELESLRHDLARRKQQENGDTT